MKEQNSFNDPEMDHGAPAGKASRKKSRGLLIVFLIFTLGLIALLSMPVTRIVSYKINVRSTPLVVFKELSASQNYIQWYNDSLESPREYLVHADKDSLKIHYSILKGERKESMGEFNIIQSTAGTTFIQNYETLQVRSLTNKMKYFLMPGSFKTFYNKKVDRLRKFLEETRWESAGVRFSPSLMPHHFIAAYGDSIRTGTEDLHLVNFYNAITSRLDTSNLINATRPQSRRKLSSGSSPYFQVGIQLKDSTVVVPKPLLKLEVPECKIIIGAIKGNYSDLEESLEIMKDWIKKNQLVTATNPWVEHKFLRSNQVLATDSLYIIQPVYFYPGKENR